jgi:hypothetical protein
VDEKLCDLHQQLKEERTSGMRMQQEWQRSVDMLEKEEEMNRNLAPEVERFKQRQAHLDRVKLLTQKKRWMVSV